VDWIGSPLDDAIVDAENVYRCLRENKYRNPSLFGRGERLSGSSRFGIWSHNHYSCRLFPIFALSGVEGSIFIPMGLGYLAAVLASMLLPQSRLPWCNSVALWSFTGTGTVVARFFKGIYCLC